MIFTSPKGSLFTNNISTDMFNIWIILNIFHVLIYVVSSSPSWYSIQTEEKSKLERANNDYGDQEPLIPNYICEYDCTNWPNKKCKQTGYEDSKWGKINQGFTECIAKYTSNGSLVSNYPKCSKLPMGCTKACDVYCPAKSSGNKTISTESNKPLMPNYICEYDCTNWPYKNCNQTGYEDSKWGKINQGFTECISKYIITGSLVSNYPKCAKLPMGCTKACDEHCPTISSGNKTISTESNKPLMPNYICEYDCTNWPYKNCNQTGYEDSKWGKINQGSSECISKYTSSGNLVSNYPKCAKLPMGCIKTCDEHCPAKSSGNKTISTESNKKLSPNHICEYDCNNWPYKNCKQKSYEDSKWGEINQGSSECIAKYSNSGIPISNYPKCAKLPMGCKKTCDERCHARTSEKTTISTEPNSTCSYKCDGWPFEQCTNVLHKIEKKVQILYISSPFIENNQRVHTIKKETTGKLKTSSCIARLYRRNGQMYQFKNYPLCASHMDSCQPCWIYCEHHSK